MNSPLARGSDQSDMLGGATEAGWEPSTLHALETCAAPDAVERARALDPGQSFIVQAPEGSGKTGLRIQRYLKLLDCMSEPEEMIAITFTRKAAAEMRERVT